MPEWLHVVISGVLARGTLGFRKVPCCFSHPPMAISCLFVLVFVILLASVDDGTKAAIAVNSLERIAVPQWLVSFWWWFCVCGVGFLFWFLVFTVFFVCLDGVVCVFIAMGLLIGHVQVDNRSFLWLSRSTISSWHRHATCQKTG